MSAPDSRRRKRARAEPPRPAHRRAFAWGSLLRTRTATESTLPPPAMGRKLSSHPTTRNVAMSARARSPARSSFGSRRALSDHEPVFCFDPRVRSAVQTRMRCRSIEVLLAFVIGLLVSPACPPCPTMQPHGQPMPLQEAHAVGAVGGGSGDVSGQECRRSRPAKLSSVWPRRTTSSTAEPMRPRAPSRRPNASHRASPLTTRRHSTAPSRRSPVLRPSSTSEAPISAMRRCSAASASTCGSSVSATPRRRRSSPAPSTPGARPRPSTSSPTWTRTAVSTASSIPTPLRAAVPSRSPISTI